MQPDDIQPTTTSIPDTNSMTPEEIAAWLANLPDEVGDKLTNPGVLRIPKDKMKEWVEADDIYITFRGVVFQLMPVSSFLAHERGSRVVYPEPPMKMNEDKGREEPDPYDPAYLSKFAEMDTLRSIITMNTYFVLGTKLLWKPDDVPDVDSTTWSEPLEDPSILGDYTMKIEPIGTRGRYVQWLKFVCMSDKDYVGLPTQIQILGGGVRAEVVQRAMSTFPGGETGRTNRVVESRSTKRRNRNSTSK